MVAGFVVSAGAIFVAELGDKSQLMAMTFATRYRVWQVLLGITIATTIVHAASVALGFGMGEAIPTEWINVLAGLAFLGFAAWTLRGDQLSEGDKKRATRSVRSALLVVTTVFLLAELGDKTMLATVTLATQHDWLGTWLGSTAGMVIADALAVGFGLFLGRRLPERTIRYGAAGLFAVLGVWMLGLGAYQLV